MKYVTLARVMLLCGLSDALLMLSHQALAFQSGGCLAPMHFAQIFSAHGPITVFFFAMTLMIGLMNFVVPLQIGARDVTFQTMSSVSFWLTAAGALLINLSFFIGAFVQTGWLVYPPLF